MRKWSRINGAAAKSAGFSPHSGPRPSGGGHYAYPILVALVLLAGVLLAFQPQGEPCMSRFSTDLTERTRNQRHNAVLAAKYLNGVVIKPGETVSFNGSVGSWSRDVGYRKAPVSYNGQLVPSWGGGVCQTSTAFYNAGLLAGLEVVERHPHRFATGYCPPGRDAAVAFSGIDLRMRNPYDFPIRVEAKVEKASLWVTLYGTRHLDHRPSLQTEIRERYRPQTFAANPGGDGGRVHNTGKDGYEVATYRVTRGERTLISIDSYPTVHRIVEYR
jgi:vancomycin resistance protein VanW